MQVVKQPSTNVVNLINLLANCLDENASSGIREKSSTKESSIGRFKFSSRFSYSSIRTNLT